MKWIVTFMGLFSLFYFVKPDKQEKEKPILVLTGGRIYTSPDVKAIDKGTVIVKEGKIAFVGKKYSGVISKNAEIIDCSGLVMTSGYWNCHIHFMEQKWQNAKNIPAAELTRQLQKMLTQYGFTYAFDLATLDLDNLLILKTRVEKGEVKGPEIFTVGVPFTPPHGSPFYIAPLKLPEINSPEEASNHVKRQIESGVDGIKIWSGSPNGKEIVYMPEDIGRAGVNTAHQYKKPVFAHPTNKKGVYAAVASNVDILAHVAAEDREPFGKELMSKMIKNNMALIPTLKLYKWDLERDNIPTENNALIETALEQVTAFSKAGGQILFGTDVGYMTDYSPNDEFKLMTKAGLTFQQILTSLTTAPAKRFGYGEQKGQIKLGMDADIVLLSADPIQDSQNFSKVKYTIRKGEVIYKSQ